MAAVEPVSGVLAVIEMFSETLTALETEEPGCGRWGWCYSIMYGALDMGSPPEPTFQGSLQGPDQDTLDHQAWEQGAANGQQALQNGADGVIVRDKVLLRVAHDGDPAITVSALCRRPAPRSTVLSSRAPSITSRGRRRFPDRGNSPTAGSPITSDERAAESVSPRTEP